MNHPSINCVGSIGRVQRSSGAAFARQSRWLASLLVMLLAQPALAADPPAARQPPDPQKLLAAQREAMSRLSMLHGTWRGPAVTTTPDGHTHEVIQTERVGPFLDGTLLVVEGRAYAADGSVPFNAMGVISYDAMRRGYRMRSYAQGFAGDYDVEVTPTGFRWEIPAGPMKMRYEAKVTDGTWTETGERIVGDAPPVKFFEMKLRRIGDTDWPAAGPVPRQ